MNKLKPLALSAAVTLLTTGSGLAFADAVGKSSNGFRIHGGDEVMLQLFHWNTVDIQEERWYDDISTSSNADMISNLGVTMVWMPPPWEDESTWSSSWSTAHNKPMVGGKEGYFWSDFDIDGSFYGSATELASAATALKDREIKVIYDMVLNHRDDGRMDPCSSSSYDCWPYGSDNRWGVNGGDDGENFLGGGPDVSLPNATGTFIHHMINLRDNYGADGWRFDYIKGFEPYHMNTVTEATTDGGFCVGEYWVDNPNMNYVVNTLASQSGCAMFDFHTYGALQGGSMYGVRNGMAANPSAKFREAAVTMIGSHDKSWSPEANAGEDYSQDLWPLPGNIYDAAMAYTLTAPGTPTLYLPDVIVTDNMAGSAKSTWEKGWVYGLAQELIVARKKADVRAWSNISFHGTTGAAYTVEGEKGTLVASIWNAATSPNAVNSFYNNSDFDLMASGGWGKIWVSKDANDNEDEPDDPDSGTSSVYSQMHVRGTYNSWVAQPMILTADNTWEAEVVSDGGTFKFDEKGNWNNNFGTGTNCASLPCTGNSLTAFGGNITMQGSGQTLKVTFNDSAMTYSVEAAGPVANVAPVARIGADATEILLDDGDIAFSAADSSDANGDTLTYEWFVDNVSKSTSATYTHTFSSLDSYDIKLEVSDAEFTSTDLMTVSVVNAQPNADAGPDLEGVKSTDIPLDATNSDDANSSDTLSYAWSCVDESGASCNTALTSTSSSTPDFNIATAGDYFLTLTVTDSSSASNDEDTDQMTIRVLDALQLKSVYPGMYLRGTPYGWTADAESQMTLIDDYTWEISATFESSGTPRFKFTPYAGWATNFGSAADCTSGNTSGTASSGGGDINVTAGAGAYRITFNDSTLAWTCSRDTTPVAVSAAAGSDQSVASGASVCFSGSASGGSTPYTYTWSNGLIGASPCQTYNNATDEDQVHIVTLSVEDGNGDVDSDTVSITVAPVANASPVAAVLARVGSSGSYTSGALSVSEGDTVNFDGSSSSDSDGTVDSYVWSGGVGLTSTTATASAQFNDPGTFVITLTVTDDDGAKDDVQYTVTVTGTNSLPTASMTGDSVSAPSTLTVDQWTTVTFDGSGSSDSDGSISTYTFTGAGMSQSGSDDDIDHTFNQVGTFSVTLTVIDNDGGQDEVEMSVVVEAAAQPEPDNDVDFTCTNGTTTAGISVYVVGNSAELGNWSVDSASQKLGASSYPTWNGTVDAGDATAWKCVKANESTLSITQWQSGDNNTISGGSGSGGF